MNLLKKLGLCYRILKEPSNNNFMAHVDMELPDSDGDAMQQRMNEQIKELALVFSTHGHSGFSSYYAISVLKEVLRFEPL